MDHTKLKTPQDKTQIKIVTCTNCKTRFVNINNRCYKCGQEYTDSKENIDSKINKLSDDKETIIKDLEIEFNDNIFDKDDIDVIKEIEEKILINDEDTDDDDDDEDEI